MKARALLICASTLLCLVLLGTVFARRQQLADLRAAQQQLVGTMASASNELPATDTPLPDTTRDIEFGNTERNELLRLRNQVSQLTQRKREMENIRAEHDRLQAQLTAKGTNAASLPAGYIRTREARWAGLATPDNTLQSFLWCVQNRDLTNLARVLTPRAAAQLLDQSANGSQAFGFDSVQVLPGMRPIERVQLPDGSLMIKVEIVPGKPGPELPMHFIPTNGEWRLDPY